MSDYRDAVREFIAAIPCESCLYRPLEITLDDCDCVDGTKCPNCGAVVRVQNLPASAIT